MQLQSAVLSTELLRLVVTQIFEQQYKNIKRIKLKIYKFTVVSRLELYSSLFLYSIDTLSSVVAAWYADQKPEGCWFKSVQVYTILFYFKSEGYGFKSSVQ